MHRWLPVLAALFGSVTAAEPLPDGLYAEIGTPRGTLTAELFFQRTPMTVTSFVGLAEGTLGPVPGKPFFDGLTFHRVVPDFVVQGGDPLGTGAGGPGYTFPDEFAPGLRHGAAGVLSMANSGPDTNGSQFFITLRETNRLNYLHSVFGRVVRSLDVLPRLEAGDTMTVRVLRLGADAQAFAANPEALAAWVARAPKARLPHLDDPDGLLPRQPNWARILDHRLANFERFTGHRIHVHLLGGEPAPGDPTAVDVARQLAERAGWTGTSAVLVYQASNDSWNWWIAETLLAHLGVTGFTNLTGGSAVEWERQFMAAAEQQAAAVMAGLPAEPPITPERRLKLRLDEILNRLLHAAEDVPAPGP